MTRKKGESDESYRHLDLFALRTGGSGSRRGSRKWPVTLGYLLTQRIEDRYQTDAKHSTKYMRLALSRGRGRRVPIHDTWRREHNIWAGGWGVRITVRIGGRRIVPSIGTRRRIWCTRKGLGRVLGKRRRVGGLFSPRGGSRLFLVATHEMFLSSVVGVALRRHGEGQIRCTLRRT
jgi:hypothetical protein